MKKIKRYLAVCTASALLLALAGCGSQNTPETTAAAQQPASSAAPETTTAAQPATTAAESSSAAPETTAAQAKSNASGDIPTLNVGWSNELHTGNMELAFLRTEAFSGNPVYLKPVSDSQLELVKDGETIAYINKILTKGAAECATLMSQGHMDVAYCSSTAMLTSYDTGTDVSVLCPVQSGGVAVVASVKAPYNTFEELVAYAKDAEMPIMGGYHSAVSSPRIVLEYALKEAGLTVTEDSADYNADVLLMDLKGLSNLIPSLSSGQVELWAGPIPNPQNAEAQGIGKIIATLDELPGGKWVDFPCCTLNIMNSVKETYPEVVQALVQATADIMDYAQTNREDTAAAMSEYVGLDIEILQQNNTTYSIDPNQKFQDGMSVYFEAMTEMGKFSDRLAGKSFEDVKNEVFDFSFAQNVLK